MPTITKKKLPALRFSGFTGEWEEKRLGEVGEFIGGGTPSTTNTEYWNGHIPWISSSDLSEDSIYHVNLHRFISQKAISGSATKLVPKNSILIVSRVGVGKIAINQCDLCTSQDFTSLKVNLGNTVFLAYMLKHKVLSLLGFNQGTSIKGFVKSDLENLIIDYPSLPEQQKIAAFLSAVDTRIQQLTHKKALLEQYKKGVMQQIFSQQVRFKDEQGREFPEWEEKRLGEIAKGAMYGMNSAAIPFDGINKYLRITDINEKSRAFLPSPLTSPEGKLEQKYKLRAGDIVFARTGASTGKSYLYKDADGNLFFAGFLIKFSITKAIPYFVYSYTFSDSYTKWVRVMSMRSGQPGINAEEYKCLKIPLPSLPEQQKIASFLSALDVKIDQVGQQLSQMQAFKKGLLQQLFV